MEFRSLEFFLEIFSIFVIAFPQVVDTGSFRLEFLFCKVSILFFPLNIFVEILAVVQLDLCARIILLWEELVFAESFRTVIVDCLDSVYLFVCSNCNWRWFLSCKTLVFMLLPDLLSFPSCEVRDFFFLLFFHS